jgi:hypothetical protein
MFTLPTYALPPIAAKLWHAASVVTCEKPCGHALLLSLPSNAAQKGEPPASWRWHRSAARTHANEPPPESTYHPEG